MTSRDNRTRPEVFLSTLPHARDLPLPEYATGNAVGMDLAAAVDGDVVIEPGLGELVPTGLRIAVPDGYEAQVRPRSGLALKHGITIPNSPGTIDPDYRGEVKVLLLNLGQEPFTVTRGMRVAQMVIVPAVRADLILVDELPATDRGDGGFGHTGA